MVFRNGFVSNSSSSSFIVIGDSIPEKNYGYGDMTYSRYDGESEYGWQEEVYTSIYDKLNWALLVQTAYSNKNNEEMIEFINKALEPYSINFIIDEEQINDLLNHGYIDHQSFDCENASMWESHSAMARWLLSSDSYIKTDNDNH